MENTYVFGKRKMAKTRKKRKKKGKNSLDLCCGSSVLGNMVGKKSSYFLGKNADNIEELWDGVHLLGLLCALVSKEYHVGVGKDQQPTTEPKPKPN